MKIFELLGPDYTIMKAGPGKYGVMKYNAHREPVERYTVELRPSGFWSDSPEFTKNGESDKNIKIVKQFLKDKEPRMTAYHIDDAGNITSKKFG